MRDNDAVLWKVGKIERYNHNMLWFEGKNWVEKRLVFTRLFWLVLQIHREKHFI